MTELDEKNRQVIAAQQESLDTFTGGDSTFTYTSGSAVKTNRKRSIEFWGIILLTCY